MQPLNDIDTMDHVAVVTLLQALALRKLRLASQSDTLKAFVA